MFKVALLISLCIFILVKTLLVKYYRKTKSRKMKHILINSAVKYEGITHDVPT